MVLNRAHLGSELPLLTHITALLDLLSLIELDYPYSHTWAVHDIHA